MSPFFLPSLFVIIGVVLETLCTGKDPSGVLKCSYCGREVRAKDVPEPEELS